MHEKVKQWGDKGDGAMAALVILAIIVLALTTPIVLNAMLGTGQVQP